MNFAEKIIMHIERKVNKQDVLSVELNGGLCNKIFNLVSACELAVTFNYQLLEPEFGWKDKILFSDIYDLDFFNASMYSLTGIKDLIIKKESVSDENRIKVNTHNLWRTSEKNMKMYRKKEVIYSDSFLVKILKSLKVQDKYQHIISLNSKNSLAVQFRIESDWVEYSKTKSVEENEVLLTSADQLIDMILDFNATKDIFFTTGENQEKIQHLLAQKGIQSSYFYDPSLEYEINAAINFEILAQAKACVGLSRSSFSNMIALKRQLILGNNENYIYNISNKITARQDFGLYPKAIDAITKKPVLK